MLKTLVTEVVTTAMKSEFEADYFRNKSRVEVMNFMMKLLIAVSEYWLPSLIMIVFWDDEKWILKKWSKRR